MKDWAYWKTNYIEEQRENSLQWFRNLEKLTMSPIECIAMMHLIQFSNQFPPLEVDIRPQYQIDDYTVDFLVFDRETGTKIIVECDGHEFHERTKQQAEHDKRRDRYLTKLGYIVLRYTGSQICENPQEIVDDVADIITSAYERLFSKE